MIHILILSANLLFFAWVIYKAKHNTLFRVSELRDWQAHYESPVFYVGEIIDNTPDWKLNNEKAASRG